ncbi:MAG TPA: PilT/PilU family type 4a pilus ATPase [Acidimicrobiales bacterium]|nr:PilT/PilU family type 4a pilus ATPase [Acidimicrobiales bacterium]
MSPQSTANRADLSRRLARALVASGYAEEETVAPHLAEAGATDTPLSMILIARGALPATVVVNTLSQLARLPVVDLFADPPTAEAIRLLPPGLGSDHKAVPIRMVDHRLLVAFEEPPELADVRSLGELVGHELLPVLADPMVIEQILRAHGADPGAPPKPIEPASAAAPREDGTRAPVAEEIGLSLHVNDLLRYAVKIGASDLHLTAGLPPAVRLHGALRPMEDVPVLDPTALRELIFGILPQAQRERFEADHELDTSHTIAGVGRFRVNLALQRGTITVALRPIPHEIPEFGTLGLPDGIRRFTDLRRGLVLVTGPTGSGKSTSLASLVDIINRTKPLHIVTVEDPIEFLHDHKRSVVSQREVGSDTDSFSEALRRVLRQDPDVILVGELRDLVTISTALTAAETGHLVFATLHTLDAPSTIDRIIDVFPPTQQEQIRIQLAASLQGVVTQQLVPTEDGQGRAVAAEVLVGTPAIQNLIRGAKTHQIYSLMQTGGQHGMQTMDQSLALLVRRGIVTEGVALDRCRSEEDFRNHLHNL